MARLLKNSNLFFCVVFPPTQHSTLIARASRRYDVVDKQGAYRARTFGVPSRVPKTWGFVLTYAAVIW